MQISFLRLGVKDYPNRVGFACEVDGKLLAFSDVNKALAHVDYINVGNTKREVIQG
jgi:hypothetical protein